MSFADKTAIVTGGAQGIGSAYVRLLAEQGANVVIADINESKASTLAAQVNADGGRAIAIQVDVSSESSCEACVANTSEVFGRIDYLVNNAGLLSSYLAPPLSQLAHEEFMRVMAVNCFSVFLMSKAVVPHMRSRGGAIVSTSSVASWQASGVYSLSKLCINGLTATLARELASFNIRVNAVAPGPVDTDGLRDLNIDATQLAMWAENNGKPTNAVAQPIDIARVGVFLLSDAAHYVNGQIVAADGATIVRL